MTRPKTLWALALAARDAEIYLLQVVSLALYAVQTEMRSNDGFHRSAPDIPAISDMCLALWTIIRVELVVETTFADDHRALWTHHDLTFDQFVADRAIS